MLRDSRHDAGQVKHLSRQVREVAVDEDEKWLDDARVRGEAGGEGWQDAVDGPYHYTTQRHHQEGHNAQEDVYYGHCSHACELLKQVIQNLENITGTHRSDSQHTHL